MGAVDAGATYKNGAAKIGAHGKRQIVLQITSCS